MGNGHSMIAVGADQSGRPCRFSRTTRTTPAEELEARLGPRAAKLNPVVGTVFPNFSLLRGSSHAFRVWHPKGTGQGGDLVVGLRRRGRAARSQGGRPQDAVWGFGPSGTFEQDDMDNWQECTQTSRGVVARRQMLNYQMGLGHESYNQDYEAV